MDPNFYVKGYDTAAGSLGVPLKKSHDNVEHYKPVKDFNLLTTEEGFLKVQ